MSDATPPEEPPASIPRLHAYMLDKYRHQAEECRELERQALWMRRIILALTLAFGFLLGLFLRMMG